MAEIKEARKRAAAARAVELLQSGMAVGLGTGSTARFVAEEIAARLRDGRLRDLACVPTSEATRSHAETLGIPLTTLDDHPTLDIAIDGADEIDPNLNLIKGAGGALLREKIVACAATRFIVVGDDSKRVNRLGELAALPIEVVRFGWKTHVPAIKALGGQVALRVTKSGAPFLTDEENYILDARFDRMGDPGTLQDAIRARAGVVETGLFLGIAAFAIVGTASGTEILTAPLKAAGL
jgi:ribose 5-phosphate isomerase A